MGTYPKRRIIEIAGQKTRGATDLARTLGMSEKMITFAKFYTHDADIY